MRYLFPQLLFILAAHAEPLPFDGDTTAWLSYVDSYACSLRVSGVGVYQIEWDWPADVGYANSPPDTLDGERRYVFRRPPTDWVWYGWLYPRPVRVRKLSGDIVVEYGLAFTLPEPDILPPPPFAVKIKRGE